MSTYYAPRVADLFLFCYESDFMMYLSDDKQVDISNAFKNYIQIFCGYVKHR